MKLRPLVASLMVLGLSAPAFAADSSNASTQQQLDQMKAELNKMQAVINQNSAGGFQQTSDWFNRITLSGMVNVDGAYANRAPVAGTSHGSVSNIDVNNANLFVDALVNDWTTFHANFAYSNNVNRAFNPYDSHSDRKAANLDEAYVTIGNLAQSPFYFRAGKEYLPFGQYDRYPMVLNPTQLLTQTDASAAQVGFVSPTGVYGSIYGFRGVDKEGSANRPRVENGGANLGYAFASDTWSAKLDAGWLANMADVNYISDNVGNGYTKKANGLSLNGDFSMQQFDVAVRYVKALQSLNYIDNNEAYNLPAPFAHSAKPSAFGAEVGYSFPVVNNHPSRIGIGYQHTKDAAAVPTAQDITVGGSTVTVPGNSGLGAYGLPQDRYYALYTVNVSKWTDLGFEVYHDKDYSKNKGGNGKNATAGVVRLGVKFA